MALNPIICALLAGLALAVAGCSSSGGGTTTTATDKEGDAEILNNVLARELAAVHA